MLRSHTCGELRLEAVGTQAVLAGWVQRTRDHGGLIFVDLRDRYGVTQVVFDPAHSKLAHRQAEHLRKEFCIQVEGRVRERTPDQLNPKIATGDVEVLGLEIQVWNDSPPPPFPIEDPPQAGVEVRQRHRYLDLRRPEMQRKLRKRARAAAVVRQVLANHGLLEIETPMLVRSTPEGARDFIVPSRLHPGRFYALPQSPQIYKQLLMIGGCDRYFQMARCLRDEDLRQDRQFEFTQIDLEMSFAEEDDVLSLVEIMADDICGEFGALEQSAPFPRVTYQEALEKYGSDKPDLRLDLPMTDVSNLVLESDFEMIKRALAVGGVAKVISPDLDLGRNYLDQLIALSREWGAQGMAWWRVEEDGTRLKSNLAKFFSPELQGRIIERVGAEPGSYILMVAGDLAMVNLVLSQIRDRVALDFDLRAKGLRFCWVVDFPLFEKHPGTPMFPAHHPFTAPAADSLSTLESAPEAARARAYDLVLNGVELGSGGVRIHSPELQRRIFSILGLSDEEIEHQYGYFLQALEFGTPPHAGIALGFDRLVTLLLGETDIRETIAFPKSKSGESAMDGTPSTVASEHLIELGLRLRARKNFDIT